MLFANQLPALCHGRAASAHSNEVRLKDKGGEKGMGSKAGPIQAATSR